MAAAMGPREIRLASAADLRGRLRAIAEARPCGWAEAGAQEREASGIRMELLVREREAAAAGRIEADLARIARSVAG